MVGNYPSPMEIYFASPRKFLDDSQFEIIVSSYETATRISFSMFKMELPLLLVQQHAWRALKNCGI